MPQNWKVYKKWGPFLKDYRKILKSALGTKQQLQTQLDLVAEELSYK